MNQTDSMQMDGGLNAKQYCICKQDIPEFTDYVSYPGVAHMPYEDKRVGQ